MLLIFNFLPKICCLLHLTDLLPILFSRIICLNWKGYGSTACYPFLFYGKKVAEEAEKRVELATKNIRCRGESVVMCRDIKIWATRLSRNVGEKDMGSFQRLSQGVLKRSASIA